MIIRLSIVLATIVCRSIRLIRKWGVELWRHTSWVVEYLWMIGGGGQQSSSRTRLPSFSKRTPLHDVQLLFDDGQLFYSRQILSIHSPYLNSRLNPPITSKSSKSHRHPHNQPSVDCIQIDRLAHGDALILLRCLTPGDCFMRVDMSNVLALGRASNKLEIDEVSKRCKKFLTERSVSMVVNDDGGDSKLIDLLIIVGQLGYRPLLDFLIVKGAESMNFEEIRRMYKELPHSIIVALYDLKLSMRHRQSHDWRPSSSIVKSDDDLCDCGEEQSINISRRCRKCRKLCCSSCFRTDGIGARGKCSICGECGARLERDFKKCAKMIADGLETLCVCSPRIAAGLLD